MADTASAQAAVTSLIAAINSKDTERTFIGSMVERLQATIQNLKTSESSATNSESTIRDTDFAAEMSNYTRSQILVQTGISVLSMANSLPNMVAQLVG